MAVLQRISSKHAVGSKSDYNSRRFDIDAARTWLYFWKLTVFSVKKNTGVILRTCAGPIDAE